MIIPRAILPLTLAACCSPVLAAGGDAGVESAAASQRKPILFVDRGDMPPPAGPASPWCAVYSDSLIIFGGHFSYKYPNGYQYKSVVLNQKDLQTLLKSLRLRRLWKLRSSYEVTDGWDFPQTGMFLVKDGEPKRVWVYGWSIDELLDYRADPDAYRAHHGQSCRDFKRMLKRTPKAFRNAVDRLLEFRRQHEDAQDWSPEKVEVMLRPSEKGLEPLPWPSHWPSLTDPRVRRPSRVWYVGNFAYSFLLEAAELERVRALVGKQKPIFLDGKTWEIDYRFAIPFEEIRWQEHAPRSDEPQAPNSPGHGVNTRRPGRSTCASTFARH